MCVLYMYILYMYTYTHRIISLNLTNKNRVKCIGETLECEINLKDKEVSHFGGQGKN